MSWPTRILTLMWPNGWRCLGIGVILLTTLGASRCPPVMPATLTCAPITMSVARGQCAVLPNSCADGSWSLGDEFDLNPVDGVTIKADISSARGDRSLCVATDASLVHQKPVEFIYFRAFEWAGTH
jgi:hypothetical protein